MKSHLLVKIKVITIDKKNILKPSCVTVQAGNFSLKISGPWHFPL